ncbi:hypothetical protein N0V95_001742 [Ascochyta clinopodiicola]|nr:hypothetical protein N0V95_001742 [Ascochyta clinopodiicola]
MQSTAANMQFVPSQSTVAFFSPRQLGTSAKPPWTATYYALLDTSIPLASSSSFSALIATDNTFYDTANWNSFPLPSAGTEQFSGNALQHGLTPGAMPLAMTTEEQISLLAMAPTTQTSIDISMSIPMEPSKEPALQFLLDKPSQPDLLLTRTITTFQIVNFDQKQPTH